MVALLLVVAGVSSVLSLRSPDARGDREASLAVQVVWQEATGRHGLARPDDLVQLGADEASDRPHRVSVDASGSLLFLAAQSTSGRCYALGAKIDDKTQPVGGSLRRGDACTGAEARAQLAAPLLQKR
jgi:hypothetical protein